MTTNPIDPLDPVQQAVATRLAKLRTLPVDTTRLDQKLRAQIPPAQHSGLSTQDSSPRRRWAPILSIAASLLVVITILTFALQPRPVQASPDLMFQMHNDIVAGKTPTMKVDSIEDANKAIAAMIENAPQLPNVPASHTMTCCMRNLGNKKVACVLLKNDGVPVTMSVARAADVTPPKNTEAQTLNGVTYHIQNSGNLHMVMLTHDGNWICLISEAPAQSLISLADRLPH